MKSKLDKLLISAVSKKKSIKISKKRLGKTSISFKKKTVLNLSILLSLLNLLPFDYIFSQYDIAQQIIPHQILQQIYLWSRYELGTYSTTYSQIPYYLPLTILPTILHTAYYYLIFLIPTYLGILYFYETIKRNGVKTDRKKTTLLTILYTISFFPVYSFFYQGGHFPFHNLYSLFPPIFILFYLYISKIPTTSELNKSGFMKSLRNEGALYPLLAVLFLTNIVNSNIPYFFSLNLVLLAIAIIYYIIAKARKTIRTLPYIAKLFKFYVLYFLIMMWSIVPQIIQHVSTYSSYMNQQQHFSINQWLFWQSMKFTEAFTMFWETRRYLDQIPLTVYGALAITILAFVALVAMKKKTAMITILWSTYIFVIFLANKGAYWLPQSWTLAIFKLPFLAPIRSYDKTLIFMPFLLFAIISYYILVDHEKNKRLKQLMLAILCVSQIVASYPLWSGQLVTKYSQQHAKGEDYTTAKYSPIVKIPQDYYDVAQILNDKYDDGKNQFRVLRLPYGVVNSAGWANFPKWKVNSADPTVQLFDMPTIQPQSYPDDAFGLWNWGIDWNESDASQSLWLFNFMKLTNSRYIIYHKDVKPKFVSETIEKITYYKEKGLIMQIYSGEYIDAYEISEEYWSDHFYVASDISYFTGDYENYSSRLYDPLTDQVFIHTEQITNQQLELLSNIEQTSALINYEYISPIKYKVTIKNADKPLILVMQESYHDGWQLNGVNADHIFVNGYANGWIIDPEGRTELDLTLYFAPQTLYWVTFAISSLTFLWVLYMIISNKRKK